MLSCRMIAPVAFLMMRETQKDTTESIGVWLTPLILMEVNINDTTKNLWRQSQHRKGRDMIGQYLHKSSEIQNV